MLIKINNKPVHVIEESNDDKLKIGNIILSCLYFLIVLCLLDYMSYIFFFKHINPVLAWIVNLFL